MHSLDKDSIAFKNLTDQSDSDCKGKIAQTVVSTAVKGNEFDTSGGRAPLK